MRPGSSPQLYWKVCLINGVVFVAAAALLVLSPATVSSEVTSRELGVLAVGIVVILVANALLLRGTLAPLDRLIHLMDATDVNRSDRRLPEDGRGVAGRLARSFNDLEDRLEAERAMRNVRALEAQEGERQRIAQELHDEVGQRLTVVLLGVTRALGQLTGEGAEELKLVQENAVFQRRALCRPVFTWHRGHRRSSNRSSERPESSPRGTALPPAVMQRSSRAPLPPRSGGRGPEALKPVTRTVRDPDVVGRVGTRGGTT